MGDSPALTVGVVLPVYGPAGFLEQALDAVLAQRPAPAQVVVVDDGSAVPVRLSAAHAARCQLVRVEHGGPAHARAAGIGVLDTELVALCDADDAWAAPGSLELRVRALAAHPSAALCFGRAVIVGPDGVPTGEEWPALSPGLHPGAALAPHLFERNPIPTSSVVVRRGALEGQIDTELRWAEDWDLWLRLAGRGAAFLCEPGAVVYYRRHRGALTSRTGDLARAQLELHERHAGLADEVTRRRVKARDLAALARGLVREGRYGEARETLAQAASLAPPSLGDRALRVALRLPPIRRRLGRRDPYR